MVSKPYAAKHCHGFVASITCALLSSPESRSLNIPITWGARTHRTRFVRVAELRQGASADPKSSEERADEIFRKDRKSQLKRGRWSSRHCHRPPCTRRQPIEHLPVCCYCGGQLVNESGATSSGKKANVPSGVGHSSVTASHRKFGGSPILSGSTETVISAPSMAKGTGIMTASPPVTSGLRSITKA